MKIGYISPTDPHLDVKAWSGSYYNICQALEEEGHDVEWVKYGHLLDKVIAKIYRLFYGKQGHYTHSRIASFYHGWTIKSNLEEFDLIFVPGQIEVVAGLKTKTPIVYYSDATIPLMTDYYWFGLKRRAIKEAKKIEKKGLEKAKYCLFASEWAKASALTDYGIEPEKLKVFPFGPGVKSTYTGKINNPISDLKLFFSGVEWERKGARIAVDTVKELNERGINSTLMMCGLKEVPLSVLNEKYIENLGFLDKNNPKDLAKYQKCWEQANIFILPTRAECAGIVFSEAVSYGVPSLTTDTGGISSYVKNGINGKRLPLEATYLDYADCIEKWLQDGTLQILSNNAREYFEDNISWKVWGKRFSDLCS
ncbi:glycosyltransferase family 4 protein [Limosilactobacillus ingluviei]|uniref:Glycosyltransferase, group 1 family protein n=1 Tax=Limosilactobacillus ingluviei TaxID=148604 RepID=A0A0R2GXL6_9LACO|nr:glycosyltransferase family 4 protein [Limosilactobacillus ingluviei]KRN45521.1 glycosyltransferase, group 1 family protein [Limosilactobacillus ingluviei]